MTELYQNLIDFSELIRTLQKFKKNLSEHEALHKESQLSQIELSEKAKKQEKNISELQSLSKSFLAGLVTLSKIEEKLNAWSDRFRTLEETDYELKAKIRALEDHYEKQFENLRISHVQEHADIEKGFFKEIDQKFAWVSTELSISQSKANEEFRNLKDKLKEKKSQDFESPEEKPENKAEDAKESQNSVLSVIQARISALESQLSFKTSQHPAKKIENPAPDKRATQEEAFRDLESFKQELESKLKSAISELKVENKIEEVVKDEMFKGRKRERVETQALNKEITGLEKKITVLDEKVLDMQKRHSMIELALPRRSLIHQITEKPKAEIEPVSEEEEEQSSVSDKGLGYLSESLEKIQKTLPLLLHKSELDDILSQFSKKIRESRKNVQEPEDFSPKIQEQEHRLNGFWKLLNQHQDKILNLDQLLAKTSDSVNFLSEFLKSDIDSKFRASEDSLSQKFNEFKQSFKPHEPIHSEQFFRSVILSLRNDLSIVKEELDLIKKTPIPPLQLDSPIQLEEIQEPLQIGMLQSILKQHDTAIRLLANKTFPGKTEEKLVITEAVNYLSHLEELKKEMKEILSKQEESKNLSSKDLEIVQNILVSLESKIGKEELGQMAEKNELKKIYRLLKKRIDELAELVSRKDMNSREDALFIKMKSNLECASCGQIVPDKMEGKLVYESWNRFPAKTPNFATGFSRILNSLVVSPSGALSLPKEGRSVSHLEMSSKPVTVKSKTRLVSNRISTVAGKNRG